MATEIWKIDRSTGYYKRGRRYLHRTMYEEQVGAIPKGYVVHHIDDDPQNNVLENLMAMPRGAHMAHHMAEQAHLLPVRLSIASRSRPFRDFVCAECNEPFKSQGSAPPGPRFCCRLHAGRYRERKLKRLA
jgi:hypothetical protein